MEDTPAWMGNLPDLCGFEAMTAPAHQVLAGFMHGCSPDPDIRTAATTALVLAIWQLAGRRMTHPLPSMILVNAGEAQSDPIDGFTARLVCEQEDTGPRVHRNGVFSHAPPEQAPIAMANALRKRAAITRPRPSQQTEIHQIAERFFAAQKTGFGYGRCRPYSQPWHDKYGLLTDPGDEIILRLDSPGDRSTFRHDVLHERLRELPADYEFAVQRAVRQLGAVCERIVRAAGRIQGATPDERMALFLDLHACSLRGIAISVAGLAWHALGFDTGLPRPHALKVLKLLRDRGPLPPGKLLQLAHITKSERDALLPRLAAEGLVRTDGGHLAATSFAGFVAALHARKEFPRPANAWAILMEQTRKSG